MLKSGRSPLRLLLRSPGVMAPLKDLGSTHGSRTYGLEPIVPCTCKAEAASSASAPFFQLRQGRTFASGSLPVLKSGTETGTLDRKVLYRGPWLLVFRLLVRFKIAQLGCVGALAIPFHSLATQGSVDGTQLAVTGVLFVGCAAVSTTLWYLSRRYIGEMSLLTMPHRQQLCISTLDFWGNRQDAIVDLDDLVPILNISAEQAALLARQSFIPLSVAGDRQYLLSLRHGQLLDKKQLFEVLKGLSGGQSPANFPPQANSQTKSRQD